MKDERISIVIPVHNHQEALIHALDSIASQTYSHLEVIVVDDGSEIPVREIPCGILKDIPHRIIRQKNKGAPAARNRGLREAAAEYVIFWDADVTAPRDFLTRLIAALSEHPEVAYAYTDFRLGRKYMRAYPFDPQKLRENNYIHSTALIRRTDVISWDESLSRFQDWDYWLMLLDRKKRGMYVPGISFYVQPRAAGMSYWLPRVAYHWPFRYLPGIKSRVDAYTRSKEVVMRKHQLKSAS